MTEVETTHKIEFAHDTLYQSGFPFAVLAYESYFLSSPYLHIDILQKGLAVMDATATSLCMDNKIPIVVFSMDRYENIARASFGEAIGTTVGGEAK